MLLDFLVCFGSLASHGALIHAPHQALPLAVHAEVSAETSSSVESVAEDAEGAEMELRVLDISGAGFVDQDYGGSFQLLPSITWKGEQRDVESSLNFDFLESLTYEMFEDSLEYSGTSMNFDDSSSTCTLRGPRSLQEGVAELMEFVEPIFGSSSRIRVHVLEFTDGDGEALLEIKQVGNGDNYLLEFDRLSNGANAHRYFSVDLAPGILTEVKALEEVTYTAGAYGEIAEASLIFDPAVRSLGVGTEIELRGVPTEGGLELSVCFRDTEMDALEKMIFGRDGGMNSDGQVISPSGANYLQLPRVQHASMSLQLFLEPGKPAVVQNKVGLDRSDKQCLVVFELVDLAPWSWSGEIGGLEIEALFGESLTSPEREVIWQERPARVLHGSTEEYGGGPFYMHSWPIPKSDSIATNLLLEEWDGSVLQSGNWIFHWGRKAEFESMLPAARALVTAKQSTELSLELLRGRGDNSELLVHWSLPIRSGQTALMASGLEEFLLDDYEVEVAQRANLMQGVPHFSFDGFLGKIYPRCTTSGEWKLDMKLVAHVMSDLELDEIGRHGSTIQRPSFKELTLDRTLSLKPGETFEAGELNSEEGLSLRLMVK